MLPNEVLFDLSELLVRVFILLLLWVKLPSVYGWFLGFKRLAADPDVALISRSTTARGCAFEEFDSSNSKGFFVLSLLTICSAKSGCGDTTMSNLTLDLFLNDEPMPIASDFEEKS